MNMEKLKEELRRDEGLELKPYQCTAGHWTCGYGHNLEAAGVAQDAIDKLRASGITLEQAERWLDDDIHLAFNIAVDWLGGVMYDVTGYLSDGRQRVLVNMVFNLGGRIFRFKRLRAAILAGDFETAADEMLNSKWAAQVGDRAKRLAEMMRVG